MMDKKGIGVEAIVVLAALAVFIVVASAYMVPAIYSFLTRAVGVSECNTEIIFQGGGFVSEEEERDVCPKDLIQISPEDLDLVGAQKEIAEEESKGNVYYSSAAQAQFNIPATEYWALNTILGQKMHDCYVKTGTGKALELFSKMRVLPKFDDVTCVVCSRIELTEDTKSMFKGGRFYDDFSQTTYRWWGTDVAKERYDDLLFRKVLMKYPPLGPLSIDEPVAVMMVHVASDALDPPYDTWIQLYPYNQVGSLDFGWSLPSLSAIFGGSMPCTRIIG